MKKGIIFFLATVFMFAISCNQNSKKNEEKQENQDTVEVKNEVKATDNNEIKTLEISAKKMLSIRTKVAMQNIGQEMGNLYGELMQYSGKNNVQMAGAPIAIYYSWEGTDCDFECGIIIDGENAGNDRIKFSETYSGKVATLDYYGAYDNATEAWTKLEQYIQENSLEMNGNPWEEYITDPMTEADTSKWLTKIYWPIK